MDEPNSTPYLQRIADLEQRMKWQSADNNKALSEIATLKGRIIELEDLLLPGFFARDGTK